MTYTLQVVDSAGAAQFDLNEQTGTVRTSIRAFNPGSPTGSPTFFEPSNHAGGHRTSSRDELITASLTVWVEADTGDVLFDTINDLTEALRRHSTIKFVRDGSAVTRYMDYVHAVVSEPLLLGDYNLAVKNASAELTVTLTRQPYLRGDLVSGSATIYNNPAVGGGRVVEVVNTGNADTFFESLRIDNTLTDLTARTVAVLHPKPGFATSDYLASTYFFQCESASNGTDTASVADALASGGNAKRTTFDTTITMLSRWYTNLSTLLTARHGVWDVYLRARVSSSSVDVELHWGLGTASGHSEDTVTVDSTTYTDHYLGRINVEDLSFVTTLHLALHAASPTGADLFSDVVFFVPVDQQAVITTDPAGETVRVTSDGRVFYDGSGLQSALATVAGPLPVKLQPGSNVMYLSGHDALLSGATPEQFAVSYSFYPRYWA